MHIFSDESGGSGKGDQHFLVAAVAVDHLKARRVMKTVRRLTGRSDTELKGNALTDKDRQTAISVFVRQLDSGAAVCCRRSDCVGGWALNTLSDQDLWTALTFEACGELVRRHAVRGVSPDGGRHQKEKKAIEQQLATLFAESCDVAPEVKLEESHGSPGIQVADIIANTVNRALTGDFLCQELVREMGAKGFLDIRDVDLAGRREPWLNTMTEFREGAGHWLTRSAAAGAAAT